MLATNTDGCGNGQSRYAPTRRPGRGASTVKQRSSFLSFFSLLQREVFSGFIEHRGMIERCNVQNRGRFQGRGGQLWGHRLQYGHRTERARSMHGPWTARDTSRGRVHSLVKTLPPSLVLPSSLVVRQYSNTDSLFCLISAPCLLPSHIFSRFLVSSGVRLSIFLLKTVRFLRFLYIRVRLFKRINLQLSIRYYNRPL